MKIYKSLFLILIISTAHNFAQAQGFTNLDFESATLVPTGGPSVQFDQAFPGWTGTVGGVQQTFALSNELFMDSSGITIINSNFINVANPPYPYAASLGLIQGYYTAILQAGETLGTNPQPANTSLSQTAQVPLDAQSLQFKALTGFDILGSFAVTLGGQTLSLTTLGTGADYTLYGANVNQWAGQTAQLTFTVFAENPHVNNEYLSLDAIQFSTQFVPEPSEFAFLVLGALFLGIRHWKRILEVR